MTDEYRTTIVLLVRGRFRVELPEKSVLLENEGDYLMWAAGTDHTWRAEEESVVMDRSLAVHRDLACCTTTSSAIVTYAK